MEHLRSSLEAVTHWLNDKILSLFCGYLFSILAYFLEIRGAVHVMWAAILIDLFFGIMASKIKRKEKFSMKKLEIAVARAISFTVLVALFYAMDKEMKQTFAASYYIAAWIISGAYVWSIMQNMYELFGGKIFKLLQSAVENKVQRETGINLKETENG